MRFGHDARHDSTDSQVVGCLQAFQLDYCLLGGGEPGSHNQGQGTDWVQTRPKLRQK